jgi:hypothetical protein
MIDPRQCNVECGRAGNGHNKIIWTQISTKLEGAILTHVHIYACRASSEQQLLPCVAPLKSTSCMGVEGCDNTKRDRQRSTLPELLFAHSRQTKYKIIIQKTVELPFASRLVLYRRRYRSFSFGRLSSRSAGGC